MPVNITQQNKRINELKEKWFLLEPLYFMIFTTHNSVVNNNIKTIRSGRGLIEFNPKFIANLSDNELDIVFKCELLRIMLKHPYSRRREIASLSYKASNITIKEYIKESCFKSAKDTFLTCEYDKKHFEFYYEKLINMPEESPDDEMQNENYDSENTEKNENNTEKGNQNQEHEQDWQEKEGEEDKGQNQSTNSDKTDGDEDQSKNLGDGGKNFDNEENYLSEYADSNSTGSENTENWNDDELMRNFVNDKIHDAEQSNSWGSINGKIQEQIIASCIPKANYKNILKAFRASVLSQKRRLTRMKPSRRYGFQYMGSRRDFCTKLLFAVDVSGSVSSHDLKVGFSVVNRLFKYGIDEIDVIQFDTEIKGKPTNMKKAISTIDVLGRGGTDFQPIIDYIDENSQYDGLIIFTDGYARTPSKPKNNSIRILWLFNNEDNHNYMEKSIRTIGKCAFIK